MDNTIKSTIMREIEDKAELFEKLTDVQYRIRCPFCGDSQKNMRDMHCYIKCDYSNPNEGIKYNCFLCNSNGVNVYNLLKALNASSDVLNIASNIRINKIATIDTSNINIITGDPIMNSPQVRFISRRLGEGLSYEDYSKFRIIWDMSNITKYISDTNVNLLHTIPNNATRINFLSDNKSMILSRSFLENEKESQWRKVKIFPSSGASYYVIQATIDLFSAAMITINIAEGILDILSAYKNFNSGENSIYIAALGSDYMGALRYMILKGFIGKNIRVNIYIDDGIDEKGLLINVRSIQWAFNRIKVYKNIRYKDIGVSLDKIKLMEVK